MRAPATPPAAPGPAGDVPAAADAEDLVGCELHAEHARYRVERLLGEGGMARVYFARDVSTGSAVALKRPFAEVLSRPGLRERFRREIERCQRLEHPHVVRVLGQGEHDGRPFYVLPFLSGGSLADRLSALPSRRMAPVATLAWLPVVAATLDHVHASGVLHRDVKPGNILFDDQGSPVLSDFGISRSLGTAESTLTSTGMGIGSPDHMAPEQAVGAALSPAADQYGLASTLYEALAGRPPFVSDTPLGVLVRKQMERAPTVSQALPHVPPGAISALLRALEREPGARFPSCSAFAAAFASGLAAAPAAQGATATRRRRLGRWALALALAGAAGATVLATKPSPESQEAGDADATWRLEPVSLSPEQEREAQRLGVPGWFDTPLGMRFVLIPAGTFTMGSPPSEKDRHANEIAHTVTLSRAYYLQATEVTNAQFLRFRPQHRSGRSAQRSLEAPRQPVVNVSWLDAQAYVDWLNQQDRSRRYRLPSEAEWERAARANTSSRWWWGDDPTLLERYANFGDTQGRRHGGFNSASDLGDDGFVITAPVASLDPSPWGLYDILGNAWECTADWYGAYPAEPVVDPQGPRTGTARVDRGAAFRHGPDLVRPAYRFANDPGYPLDDRGIRLVVDVPER